MHYFEFIEEDATLYEGTVTQSQNTGLDEILEVRKDMNYDGSVVNVSRALLKFDLTEISSSVVSGIIPGNAEYYLNLYDAGSVGLTTSQTLYAYAVSQSWTVGEGQFFDNPITEEGVSWRYRDGSTAATQWISGSNNTGGTWYSGSGYEASQSFSQDTTDLRMEITDIMKTWLSGSITNNGLLLKRSGSVGNTNANEDEGNTVHLGHFKFFSRETHTIYPPKVEVVWDDSTWTTGSLSPLTGSALEEDLLLYMKGLKDEYRENSKAKFRIVGRERYPSKTYATTPSALTVKHLPSGSSYYSIKDAYTEDTIVPFGSGSVLSCDSTGNFFRVWLNGLQPERYYRFSYKIVSGSGTAEESSLIFDDEWNFKVVR